MSGFELLGKFFSIFHIMFYIMYSIQIHQMSFMGCYGRLYKCSGLTYIFGKATESHEQTTAIYVSLNFHLNSESEANFSVPLNCES